MRAMGRFVGALGLVLVLLTGTPELAAESSLAGPSSARELVDRFRSVVNDINDYQVRLYEWCKSGPNYERRIIDLYFLQPRLIRMDILKGNRPFDDGSVGVYRGGSTVDGRKGGLLSGIAVTVPKKDGMATTARGLAFDESDLLSILGRLSINPEKLIVRFEERNLMYWLEIRSQSSSDGAAIREILAFDRNSFLPVFNEVYEGQELVQYAHWTNYILNAGLPDGLFQIRAESSLLRARGLPTVNGLPIDESNYTK